MHPTHSENAY